MNEPTCCRDSICRTVRRLIHEVGRKREACSAVSLGRLAGHVLQLDIQRQEEQQSWPALQGRTDLFIGRKTTHLTPFAS